MLILKNMTTIAMVVPYLDGYEVIYKEDIMGK